MYGQGEDICMVMRDEGSENNNRGHSLLVLHASHVCHCNRRPLTS